LVSDEEKKSRMLNAPQVHTEVIGRRSGTTLRQYRAEDTWAIVSLQAFSELCRARKNRTIQSKDIRSRNMNWWYQYIMLRESNANERTALLPIINLSKGESGAGISLDRSANAVGVKEVV
jgi:hypothetical protein